jgi:hypothetical protein
VSNWGSRTERTGVHRYPGAYDIHEVLRWLQRWADARRGEHRFADVRVIDADVLGVGSIKPQPSITGYQN